MATTTATVQEAEQRVAELEARLAVQREACSKASSALAELEARRTALQLEADVEGVNNDDALRRCAKQEAEQVALRDRAELAVTELERRIEAVRFPLLELENRERLAQLHTLAPKAMPAFTEYVRALRALVAAAATVNELRADSRRLANQVEYFAERHNLPKEARPPVPPLPIIPFDGWLRDKDGPEKLEQWLASKARFGFLRGFERAIEKR